MDPWIWKNRDWPHFTWDAGKVLEPLSSARLRQGMLLGKMGHMAVEVRHGAMAEVMTEEAVSTSGIDGEHLNRASVRSSVCRKLGVPHAGLGLSDRKSDGVVEMVLDATQNYGSRLTKKDLCKWHRGLFPVDTAQLEEIRVGDYRNRPEQIVSGPIGENRVHFVAPPPDAVNSEMRQFINWYNKPAQVDGLIRAAVVTLWFLIIHPFDDGNGRIARAIADKALAQDEGSVLRFYSLSSQIEKEREGYYAALHQTNHSTMDITDWVRWFLGCFERAVQGTEATVALITRKDAFWRQFAEVQFNDRQNKVINRLLDGFKGNMTSSKWGNLAKCSPATANRDILDLVDKGVLERNPGGSKRTSYRLRGGD
jgi:Fic family protein